MTKFKVKNDNASMRKQAEDIIERMMKCKMCEILSCAELEGYNDFGVDLDYLLYIYDLSYEVMPILQFRDMLIMISNVVEYFDANAASDITAEEYKKAVVYRLGCVIHAAEKRHQFTADLFSIEKYILFMTGLLQNTLGDKYVNDMKDRYKDFIDSNREPDPEDRYPYDYDPVLDGSDPDIPEHYFDENDGKLYYWNDELSKFVVWDSDKPFPLN